MTVLSITRLVKLQFASAYDCNTYSLTNESSSEKFLVDILRLEANINISKVYRIWIIQQPNFNWQSKSCFHNKVRTK